MKSKLMFGAMAKVYDYFRNMPTAAVASRAYLKSLRAAEMADWEMTGGDYVLPAFATNSFDYKMAGICRRGAQSSQILQAKQNVAFLQLPPNAFDYSEEN